MRRVSLHLSTVEGLHSHPQISSEREKREAGQGKTHLNMVRDLLRARKLEVTVVDAESFVEPVDSALRREGAGVGVSFSVLRGGGAAPVISLRSTKGKEDALSLH
jgi:hypothetical protein